MIKLYYIDKDYIDYLKKFDERVPDIEYATNEKFFIKVDIKNSEHKYYAPVSSFRKKQHTNILIYNRKGKATGSIRFAYMIPVPDDKVRLVDIPNKNAKYRDFLNEQIRVITKMMNKVNNYGNFIYNKRMREKDEKLLIHSLNFKGLNILCKKSKEISKQKVKNTIKNRNIAQL